MCNISTLKSTRYLLLFTLLLPQFAPTESVYSLELLEDYCNKFVEIMKPYICRAINFPPTTTPRPWNGTTEEYWEWEEDCSCDLNCTTRSHSDESNSEESEYKCQSCGSDCPVNTRIPPRCTCAVLGRSKKARCKCTANCASFRYLPPHWQENDDSSSTSCIFQVNNLNNGIFSNDTSDHTCECTKSKAAENNTMPDFVCICQPSH